MRVVLDTNILVSALIVHASGVTDAAVAWN
jgi:predicted nucleic acid-binding protein